MSAEMLSRKSCDGGMAASMWARRYTAEPVDVCLALGTDLDDTSMGLWRPTAALRLHGRIRGGSVGNRPDAEEDGRES